MGRRDGGVCVCVCDATQDHTPVTHKSHSTKHTHTYTPNTLLHLSRVAYTFFLYGANCVKKRLQGYPLTGCMDDKVRQGIGDGRGITGVGGVWRCGCG